MFIEKALLAVIGVLFIVAVTPRALAQTLEDCPKTQEAPWTNCKGARTYPDGSIYTGDFQDDRKHGRGVLSSEGGVSYVGEFAHDVFEGAGILWMPGGMVYVGEFREGRINGLGVLKASETDRHIGEFKDGVLTRSAEFVSKEKGNSPPTSVAKVDDPQFVEHRSSFKIDPVSLAFLLCFVAFLLDIILLSPAYSALGAGRRAEWTSLVLLIFIGGLTLGATIKNLAAPVGAFLAERLEKKEPAAPWAPVPPRGGRMPGM